MGKAHEDRLEMGTDFLIRKRLPLSGGHCWLFVLFGINYHFLLNQKRLPRQPLLLLMHFENKIKNRQLE